MNALKVIYLLCGTISLGIGLIGIVVPGLPTTVFLLLTAGLYMKSSEKWYQKLIAIPYVGSKILKYQSNRGMTRKAKLSAIATMWVMITISAIFFIASPEVKLIVLALGFLGTIIIGLFVPTVKPSNHNKSV